MWFQILEVVPHNKPKRNPQQAEKTPQNLDCRGQVEKLTVFRGASKKFETIFLTQLLIIFQNCGLRLFGGPSQNHGAPQNACHSTLLFRSVLILTWMFVWPGGDFWQTTRWSMTISSEVNLPHAINFRAKFGANLVT